jgi:hypothetical protein
MEDNHGHSSRREDLNNSRSSINGRRDQSIEKRQLNGVKTLQSVLRGHVDRLDLLKENSKSRSRSASSLRRSSRSQSPDAESDRLSFGRGNNRHRDEREISLKRIEEYDEDESFRKRRPGSRNRLYSSDRGRSLRRRSSPSPRSFSPERGQNQFQQRPYLRNGFGINPSDSEASTDRSDSRKLIPYKGKEVDKTDGGGCCSPFRMKNKKE